MPSHKIDTAHGLVYVTLVGPATPAKPTLLLIHGNSSSSKIFQHIIASTTISSEYRILACDLPGHGLSSDAIDPKSTYSMGGYASCILQVLAALSIRDVVILGWSLGGHIGLEMIAHSKGMVRIRGALLVGTPPSRGPEVSKAFLASPRMRLTSRECLTPDEAYQYAHEAIGNPFEDWHKLDAVRTDGRARSLMFQSFKAGSGVDQAKLVAEENSVLFGVVNGSREPFVNLDYVDGLQWANLWDNHCHRLPGLGHAPFWEAPEEFEVLLARFMAACL